MMFYKSRSITQMFDSGVGKLFIYESQTQKYNDLDILRKPTFLSYFYSFKSVLAVANPGFGVKGAKYLFIDNMQAQKSPAHRRQFKKNYFTIIFCFRFGTPFKICNLKFFYISF